MSRRSRNRFVDVPVLHNLAGFDTEDIDMGTTPIAGSSDDVNVQDHMIIIDEHSTHISMQFGKLGPHSFAELPQSVQVIGNVCPVLNVRIT